MRNGGPAFPVPETVDLHGTSFSVEDQGMNLRDYFAAQVMAGDAANSAGDSTWQNNVPDEALLKRAQLYYRIADAMLKARE